MKMSRTRQCQRSRRGRTPWGVTVLGAAVGGAVRAACAWLFDRLSD